MNVTLEDLYNGKTAKMAVTRDRLCSKCDGKGGDNVKECTGCNGRGMRTTMMQMGPGMYSQRTGPCDECGGRGEMVKDKDKCKGCNGKKTLKEKKIIEVQVDKGAPNGEKYVFHGEADEVPGAEPGDVIFVVNEKPHKTFKRKGADLLIEKHITLYEALTGYEFVLTHLDGKKVHVSSNEGEVIKPSN
jgi:DnaJ family protein A protein 2